MTRKLHPGEPDIDAGLVRRLLAAQLPELAALPLQPVEPAGTDHVLYRLGAELVVRLPRIGWARDQVAKEQRWLPLLAPALPLAIPTPLAQGRPGEGYPWCWAMYRWLPGEAVTLARLSDPFDAARQLARFIAALHGIDASAGPAAGEHNSWRGVPLAERDAITRRSLDQLRGSIDVRAATAAWDAALRQPQWHGPPVWVHGDLQPGNLLASAGQLCAVIDFGCLGAGDPAVDLIVAWNLLPAAARAEFRAELGVADPTWARGRGWALYTGLVALPYYRRRNPRLAGLARHTLQAVLAE